MSGAREKPKRRSVEIPPAVRDEPAEEVMSHQE